jgi:hypothetical protein
MAEEPWIPLESDGKWAGGFCHLLRECLESAGVETDRVSYEGRTIEPLDQSATFLIVTVLVDPQCQSSRESRCTASRVPPWRRTRSARAEHSRRFASRLERSSRTPRSAFFR